MSDPKIHLVSMTSDVPGKIVSMTSDGPGKIVSVSLGPMSIMRYFKHDWSKGSPEVVRAIKPICDLAISFNENFDDCPEKSVVLRKLLEAKDAALRVARGDEELY